MPYQFKFEVSYYLFQVSYNCFLYYQLFVKKLLRNVKHFYCYSLCKTLFGGGWGGPGGWGEACNLHKHSADQLNKSQHTLTSLPRIVCIQGTFRIFSGFCQSLCLNFWIDIQTLRYPYCTPIKTTNLFSLCFFALSKG